MIYYYAYIVIETKKISKSYVMRGMKGKEMRRGACMLLLMSAALCTVETPMMLKCVLERLLDTATLQCRRLIHIVLINVRIHIHTIRCTICMMSIHDVINH